MYQIKSITDEEIKEINSLVGFSLCFVQNKLMTLSIQPLTLVVNIYNGWLIECFSSMTFSKLFDKYL